ncbi:hypothetical protein G6F68_020411 [Rhizopus microsporus]|nr:hypothetical protein G6F68_020411 [Rhizopus microsporus]
MSHAVARLLGLSSLQYSIKATVKVCKPSSSSIESKKASVVALSASIVSSSSVIIRDSTRDSRIAANRLFNAGPATVTRDASARALKAVIGTVIKVGMSTGKTALERTDIISLSADKA